MITILIAAVSVVTFLFVIAVFVNVRKQEEKINSMKRDLSDAKEHMDAVSRDADSTFSSIKDILYRNQTESLQAASNSALAISQIIKDLETGLI